MKVTVNVDCTPEEARAFLGLPDLAPVHAVYIERMQGFIRDGLQPSDIEKAMRQWLPQTMDGIEAWQKLFWQAATGAAQAGKGK